MTRKKNKRNTKPRLKSSTKPRLKQKQVAKQSVKNKPIKKTILRIQKKVAKQPVVKTVTVIKKVPVRRIVKTVIKKVPVVKTVTVIKKVIDTKETQKLAKEKTTLQNTVTDLQKQNLTNQKEKTTLQNIVKQLLTNQQKQPDTTEFNKQLEAAEKRQLEAQQKQQKQLEAQRKQDKKEHEASLKRVINEAKKESEASLIQVKKESEAQQKQLKKEHEAVLKLVTTSKPTSKTKFQYKMVTLKEAQKEWLQIKIIAPLESQLPDLEASPLYKDFNPMMQSPGHNIHFSNLWKQILQGNEDPELFKRYAKASLFLSKETASKSYMDLKSYLYNGCPNFKTDREALLSSKTKKNKNKK